MVRVVVGEDTDNSGGNNQMFALRRDAGLVANACAI